ncbi:uncharacterized protein NECHADRAFT_50799 [Fusarium vanettenii 77-13-4]|uniref:Ubiquitin-like domain-containing protein n=1 Tax=Fusarium vanettenii (strain ATCC MYA-4622 / CBS 123669 / FGSC 9596 / NRRL 45880 / 77-13-4) TaxID=660122 RepID=C7Z1M8_FUSV7|nr:uncharacterized protein NECHADRAFT_50799 [Fusarium vanettenii 77-13-4]EEU41854.1 hypothetical protein NECHADRAFT_50799 [Fusarium vanettenii 77-13-4]
MASKPPTARPNDEGPDDASSGSSVDDQTVNLQVVSPSVGVNRPLLFPGIAANTTVKQLKERIRQTLPLRPSDEHQRLIHRGRAIVRESDTLLDIFGADALRTPEQQTIHLVIRDTRDSQSSTPTVPPVTAPASAPAPAPAPARGPSPTASAPPTNVPRQHVQHAHGHAFGYQTAPGFTWRHSMPPTSNPFPQPRMPSPSPSHTPEQAAAFQHHHQNMTQWLNNIQREAMARALNQNQRTRAQMGMRGVGDTAAGNAPAGDNSGRASPAPGHTIYREHVGPNGHTYQVETVVRTPGQGNASGAMSPADVQNIIRTADVNQATLAMTSAMQRSASSTSLYNRSLAQPGVTTPAYPTPSSMAGSGRGTPDHSAARLTTAGAPGSSQSRPGSEVYILSSPEGPRALLFNNTGAETYYTPRLRGQASFPQLRTTPTLGTSINDLHNQMRARHHHHHHHHHLRPQTVPQPLSQIQPQVPPQPQLQVQQQQQQQYAPPQQDQARQDQGQNQAQVQQDQMAAVAPLMHRGNPPAAALPPLLMQLWPQMWLLFRLTLFVWFFTSPTASWSRWFTIITIAVLIFVISTGVLNGVPDHIWRPLGRHLENLIPMEQPRRPHAGPQGAPQRGGDQNGQARQEPNPEDMARRLVAQHQGPESWIISQVRRLERAGLLFLASIAPGVAERHIANLEAAARAERERREAEAAAAAAAAEAAAAQENENNENQEATSAQGENADTGTGQGGEQAEGQGGDEIREERGVPENNEANEPVVEQLVAV